MLPYRPTGPRSGPRSPPRNPYFNERPHPMSTIPPPPRPNHVYPIGQPPPPNPNVNIPKTTMPPSNPSKDDSTKSPIRNLGYYLTIRGPLSAYFPILSSCPIAPDPTRLPPSLRGKQHLIWALIVPMDPSDEKSHWKGSSTDGTSFLSSVTRQSKGRDDTKHATVLHVRLPDVVILRWLDGREQRMTGGHYDSRLWAAIDEARDILEATKSAKQWQAGKGLFSGMGTAGMIGAGRRKGLLEKTVTGYGRVEQEDIDEFEIKRLDGSRGWNHKLGITITTEAPSRKWWDRFSRGHDGVPIGKVWIIAGGSVLLGAEEKWRRKPREQGMLADMSKEMWDMAVSTVALEMGMDWQPDEEVTAEERARRDEVQARQDAENERWIEMPDYDAGNFGTGLP